MAVIFTGNACPIMYIIVQAYHISMWLSNTQLYERIRCSKGWRSGRIDRLLHGALTRVETEAAEKLCGWWGVYEA